MSKKSVVPGASTSQAEITNIGVHGLWMLVDGREHFLDYQQFPWFKDATVAELMHFERPQHGHFWWPDLDVDLSLDSLFHPEKYPLKAKVQPRQRLSRAA